jgi:chondroitin AC lyase
VVPNVSEQQLNASSQNNRSVKILSNTPALQAVRQDKLGISQLAFYKAGIVEIEKEVSVRLDSPGMVMLKTREGRLHELTLSDPSRMLSRMLVSVSGIYKVQGDSYRTLVDESKNVTLFIVDLPQGVYLGKSVHLEVE